MIDFWAAREPRPAAVADAPPVTPADVELERSVLGAALFSEQVLPVLAIEEGLTSGAFYLPWHGRVWDAMLALHQAGEPVEVASVVRHLNDAGLAGDDVDALVLAPQLANVRFYGRRLVRLAEWRAVLMAGHELVAAAGSLDDDRRERAEAMLAARDAHVGPVATADTLRAELWGHFDGGESTVGLPIPRPFAALDRSLGALRPGETTLLGGWTSRGKSVCADQILSALGRQGHRVHLYINEMTTKVRGLRILAAESGVPLQRLLARVTMDDAQRKAVIDVLGRGMPFGITEVAGWGAPELARELRHRRWDVAVIDILHLIDYDDESDLRRISGALGTAARLTGTHLILTVHLNEARATSAALPPPVIRDIRGSGMLKNNADNVMFVHRTDEVDEHGVSVVGDESQVYLAKCRNGALGGVSLLFDGPRVRFVEEARA